MNELRTYIDEYSGGTISDADYARVLAAFTPRKYRRRQYFLQQGEVCKYTGFVLKGAFRQYRVDEKGAEHTAAFATENWWVTDRESLIMLTPSHCNIEALEDAEVLLTTNAQVQELIQTVPGLAQMFREMDQRNFFATQRRLHTTLGASAEARYAELLARHPDYFQRFPLHLIASYLGITPETLSRVRHKVLHP